MLLKQANVRISTINTMAFKIDTAQDSYKLTRSILLTLKEEYGLPLRLHSEEVSEISVRKTAPATTSVRYSPETIFEDSLPPRYGNMFLVPGHYLVGKNKEKMVALAKEVAQRLESFGLSVALYE